MGLFRNIPYTHGIFTTQINLWCKKADSGIKDRFDFGTVCLTGKCIPDRANLISAQKGVMFAAR